MKILIDNSILFAGGGIQVATSFLNDLNNLNLEHVFHVVQSPYSASQIDKNKFKNNFHFYNIPINIHKRIGQRSKFTKDIEDQVNPDIIFTTFGPSYYKSNKPKIVGFAIPHLIYKESPFFQTLGFFEKLKLNLISSYKRGKFIKNSNVLIFESEEARKRLKKVFNGDTYVVPNTLNEIFKTPERWSNVNLGEKEAFNILYLTANYPHKNLEIIPAVIDSLIDLGFKDFKFYLSINESELKVNDQQKRHLGFLGKVNITQVPNIYREMNAFFMPSLLEVFSTSYLEAMYMKVPIVASDMPFSRDICGESALYAGPNNADEYALKLIEIYSNTELKDKLIDFGLKNLERFSDSMGRTKKYLEIIEKHAINRYEE